MKTKGRGRPKGSKNKKSSIYDVMNRGEGSVKRRYISKENKKALTEEDSFDYDNIKEDHGVIVPKEYDVEEELSLMGTYID